LWEAADLTVTREEWNKALSQRHGEELQKKFSSATVAVCGVGGLGSNIAISLARAGIGKLILIDFDRVDITNLHRQQYKANQIGMNKTDALRDNLLEIAPYVAIETHTERVAEENAAHLLQGGDIICEAFDVAECKAMLTNLVLETMPDKYLVAASGMAGMGSANTIQTRRVSKRFYLCGDERSDVQSEGSLISSRVMLCAAHQAHTVLRILVGEFET
jgi:sulfur carrier protein ThiS adenylyltransferase